MLGAEDLEDVEHGKAGLVHELALSPHLGEELVERRLVLGLSGEAAGQFEASPAVVGLGLDTGLQRGDVEARGGLDPGRGLEAVHLCVRHQPAEHDQCLVGLATVHEHGGETRPGFGVIGASVKHLAKQVLGGGVVAFDPCRARLIHHTVELVWHDRANPVGDRRLGKGAGESGHLLAVAKGDHGRDALDRVLLGELLVGVDVDLDQLERSAAFLGDVLKRGAEDLARLAPLRPEVDDDGDLPAALQHILGKRSRINVFANAHGVKVTLTLPATVDGMEHRPEAPFGAVLTAIITPFHEDGSVDFGTFARLAEHLVSHGSDGLVVCGTTGESPTLNAMEKVALYQAAVDAVGDRAAVVAGTGTYDTRESIEFSERAAEVGCHAVMAVTPYYSKPPQEGIFRHMTAIADATDLPLMVYNIPGRTCRLIEVETLQRLAEHSNIVAVKDAVDDVAWTTEQIAALPEGFAVYSGSDDLTLDIIRAGGVGVVSVASHLAGDQIRAMIEAAMADKDDEADRLHQGLMPLFTALFVEPSPMPLKAGLSLAWDVVGEPRLPLVPASEKTVAAVREALVGLEGL